MRYLPHPKAVAIPYIGGGNRTISDVCYETVNFCEQEVRGKGSQTLLRKFTNAKRKLYKVLKNGIREQIVRAIKKFYFFIVTQIDQKLGLHMQCLIRMCN